MQIGYKLATEAFSPTEIVRQAVAAEQAGFDFVEMSDHFHPWLETQGHSGFTWSMLGAMAARTERVGLVTGVTCPSFRYHPAIVAQAAATVALLSDGRFTLGVGAGERLNEHIVGTHFPAVGERHKVFREALEIIRLLWQGGYQSYDGRFLKLEDAQVFDLPKTLPPIIVAGSGPASLAIAKEYGDGVFATDPDVSLVDGIRAEKPAAPCYAEVALAWAPSVDAAAQEAHAKNRWAVGGWKVMAELPNPVNFEAAATTVTLDDVKDNFACGPDVAVHVEAARPYVDAGYDHLVLLNAGPDPDGFLRFFTDELGPALRDL